MHSILALLVVVFLCTSCATILNGKHTRVTIHAPEGTEVYHNTKPYTIEDGNTRIFPRRSKDSLRLTLTNDGISTNFALRRKYSGLFYYNIIQNYGLGMLIDLTNDKRFTYTRHLNFTIDSVTNAFHLSKKKTSPFKRNTTLVYTSPLMAIDIFSQPMISLGGEYFFIDNISISAEYGSVYFDRLRTDSKLELVKNKGRSYRYELKFYNVLNITNNPRINEYIGVEARFLRHQFNDGINYLITEDEITYTKSETLIVKKSVDVFNLKYGLNFPLGKHLFIDLYSGFGWRIRNIKNPNRFYDPEIHGIIETGHYGFFSDQNLEDFNQKHHFNFSLGFKFGIKL